MPICEYLLGTWIFFHLSFLQFHTFVFQGFLNESTIIFSLIRTDFAFNLLDLFFILIITPSLIFLLSNLFYLFSTFNLSFSILHFMILIVLFGVHIGFEYTLIDLISS